MLTQHLPTFRRILRGALKYGVRRELFRLRGSESGGIIGRAFLRALDFESGSDSAEYERGLVSQVEQFRRKMNDSDRAFVMQDFGAGPDGQFAGLESTHPRPVERRIGELSRESSVDEFWGRVLFYLIRGLRPSRCLEMGGLVGVSAGYQCAALAANDNEMRGSVGAADEPLGGAGRCVVLEGDPTLAQIVHDNLLSCKAGPNSFADFADIIVGRFDDTLPGVLEEQGPFDMAFIDGHHEKEATIRYFDLVRPHLAPGAVVVFDDIAWSAGMRQAWDSVSAAADVAVAVSANQFGIVRMGGSTPEATRADSTGKLSGGGLNNTPRASGRGHPSVDHYRLWLV